MKHQESEFVRQIRQEVEEEKRKSRYRNRCNWLVRVHPTQHDVDLLSEFCITRRISRPGTLPALKRIHGNSMDTAAFRFLVALVLAGSTYKALRHCCTRILESCTTHDEAVVRFREFKARWLRGEPLSDPELQLLREQLSEENQKRFDAELARRAKPVH